MTLTLLEGCPLWFTLLKIMNNNLTAINTFNHPCLKRLQRLNISVTAVLHRHHGLAQLLLCRKNFPRANTSSPQSMLIITKSVCGDTLRIKRIGKIISMLRGLGTAFLPVTQSSPGSRPPLSLLPNVKRNASLDFTQYKMQHLLFKD